MKCKMNTILLIFIVLLFFGCENIILRELTGVFNVTFDTNGGSPVLSVDVSTIEKEPETKKENNIFDGWFLKADFSDQKISFPYKLSENVTMYAKWLPTYVVEFETNGGTPVNSIRTRVLEIMPEIQKANYVFDGWYASPDFLGTAIRFPYELDMDIKLYAKWLPTYVVEFETNGGIKIDSFRNIEISELQTPIRDYYNFAGWFIDEQCITELSLPYTLTKDITVYAKWEPIVYKIQYVLNDGTNSPNNPISYTVEDNIVLEDAVFSTWKFIGWYLDENFKVKVASLSIENPKDLVLYAKFALFEMVKIPGRNFEMGKTEVTQKLYEYVMGENPSKYKNENRPVEKVSWYDAIYFCNTLSIKEGLEPVYSVDWNTDVTTWNYSPHKGNSINSLVMQNLAANGYRLPTDDEWEYAVKGGEKYSYAGSSNINDVAWVSSWDNSLSSTQLVAKKNPNGYGLYDMLGNVQEWNWDSINTGYRNVRGGSYLTDFDYVRGTAWNNYYAYYKMDSTGFRIARSLCE